MPTQRPGAAYRRIATRSKHTEKIVGATPRRGHSSYGKVETLEKVKSQQAEARYFVCARASTNITQFELSQSLVQASVTALADKYQLIFSFYRDLIVCSSAEIARQMIH